MITALKIIVTLVFGLLLLWIGFSNQESVTLMWSPVHPALQIPLALLVFIACLAGFVWGGLIVWLNGGVDRTESRARKKEILRLQKEIATMNYPSSSKPIEKLSSISG